MRPCASTPRPRRSGSPTTGRRPILADTVELTFVLDPAATRVRARVAFRRNPARAGEGPLDLRLDGRNLRLVSAAIDGAPVPQNALALDDEGLTVAAAHVPRRLHLGGRDRDRARGEHRARGPLHVARHVLHPVRGAGLPQDHLLARPARRDGELPRADRGRRAGAALERQPRGLRPRLGRMGGPVPQALLPVRAGRRRSRRGRGPFRHPLGPRRAAADLGARRRRGPLRLRHGRAEAVDGLGRARNTAASTTSTAS